MAENCTFKLSGDGRLDGLWSQLSRNQQRFCVAMLEYPTKKEAAEAIGLDPRTVYRWPDAIDEAIEFLISDAIQSAHDILEQSVVKAAQIKRAGLDSDDEKLRQGVSSEILDRMLGRATQRQEISGPEGGPIQTEDVSEIRRRLLEDIQKRVEADDAEPTGEMA